MSDCGSGPESAASRVQAGGEGRLSDAHPDLRTDAPEETSWPATRRVMA